MTNDLLHDRMKILLIKEQERNNPCMVEICETALRVLDADKRGYAPQYLNLSQPEER